MLNSSFSSHRAVWVEITESSHDHGGEGWEFGTCLWSPVRDDGGRHRYRIMTLPEPDDVVLHFYKDSWDDSQPFRRLCAQSLVDTPAREVQEEPPSPGPWEGMEPFYRMELTDFRWFDEQLDLGEFLDIYADEILQRRTPTSRSTTPSSGTATTLELPAPTSPGAPRTSTGSSKRRWRSKPRQTTRRSVNQATRSSPRAAARCARPPTSPATLGS